MSTTGFVANSRLKALRFTALMLATTTLAACQSGPSSDHAVRVIRVAAAHYGGGAGGSEAIACHGWRLGASQVKRFFALSERFEESPYDTFYQVPCSISGELQSQGRTWDFRINGGATAVWTSGGETRYWGCSDGQCAALVILATDLMAPDAATRRAR